MIECGWCGKPTTDAPSCIACRHAEPRIPWIQRATPVPKVEPRPGRPALSDDTIRQRLAAMPGATDEQLAEHFEVDPRTIRRWRQKVSG